MAYKAVLFASDGAWVTDHRYDTIEAVEEALAEQGSRWFFYPFHAVIVDHGALTTDTQRVVSVAWPFEDMKGRTIRTFGRTIDAIPNSELEALLS